MRADEEMCKVNIELFEFLKRHNLSVSESSILLGVTLAIILGESDAKEDEVKAFIDHTFYNYINIREGIN